MVKYSLRDIINSYEQKRTWEKQFPVNYYIIRPFSFLVTHFVIRVSTSPSKIAAAGLLIGMLGCLSFLGLSLWTAWPGIILLFTFSLLDAVDGNIARTTHNVTHYGKFLDSLIGEIIEGSYCFWISLGVTLGSLYIGLKPSYFAHDVQRVIPLVCGTIIMAGRLYSSFIEMNYERNAFEKEATKYIAKTGLHNNIKSSTFRKNWLYLIFVNLNCLNNQILLLFFCILIGKIDIFLYLFALYYIIRVVTYAVYFLFRAQKQLN